jgi:hypothetical protein
MMMIRVCILSILCLLCVPKGNAQEVVFPLPTVPDSLREPQQRLVYVLDHYWENYAWNDTTALNQTVGEQGLVDFLDLLQYADSLTADRGAAAFVSQAFTTDGQRQHYAELLDHYLYDRHSPVRNDLVYAHLLRHLTTPQAMPDETERQRLQFRLQNISKNQVGTIAADFSLRHVDVLALESQGTERLKAAKVKGAKRLYDVVSPLTLLMFYDPDCEDCHVAEAQMAREPLLHDARLTLIRAQRKEVGDRYFVHFTPSFYLLDADKRVLVKNASLEQVLRALFPEPNNESF